MGAWCQAELSSEAFFSGCCCHWTRYLGGPRLGIPATIRKLQTHRVESQRKRAVWSYHICVTLPWLGLGSTQPASWWPLRRSSGDQAHAVTLPQYQVALALGTSHSPLNGGTGAQRTLPWLSPSCSNLAPYTVPQTGQGLPSWGQKSLVLPTLIFCPT